MNLMELEEVVRENIIKLIERFDEGNQSACVRRCQIAQKTINGICRARAAASIASISQIAKGYDIEPWMLLIPNLDVDNPPTLNGFSDQERQLYERLRSDLEALKIISK